MWPDRRHEARHDPALHGLTDDELSVDAVDAIVLDAQARIGEYPEARFAFFKRLLAVAQAVAGQTERGQ